MISIKSVQRLCQPSKLGKLHAVNRLHSSNTNPNNSNNATQEQHLSREQVLEIYDLIAQLNAQ